MEIFLSLIIPSRSALPPRRDERREEGEDWGEGQSSSGSSTFDGEDGLERGAMGRVMGGVELDW